MSPLVVVLAIAAVVSAACWVASLLTKDTSWVDRIWSIVPVVYVWTFAVAAIAEGEQATRLVVMAVLVTLWGTRLTYNFARKGGYSGVEDYRWAILRARMRGWQFQLFNLGFIVLFQNALLVLITLPALVAWQHPGIAGPGDAIVVAVLAALFLLALAGELVADEQQWRFQQAKRAAGGQLEPGFVTTGLFAWSRHPNFFFEQVQWWIFSLLGASAAMSAGVGVWGGLLHWTMAGAVLLTLLFIGSTIFTESISRARHPAYREYQRTTPMLVPRPPRASSRAPR